MLGGVLLVLGLVVLFVPLVLVSGGVAAALLGWLLNRDVDASHEGSELLDLNV